MAFSGIKGRKFSRRDALRMGAATLASGAIVRRFTYPGTAHADSPYVTGPYKALVCIQLVGGNNGFNMLVPVSPNAYSTYQKSRGSLAIASSSLLALNGTASDGNTYGFHPSCPELQALFNSGKLAIVNNVGTIIQPTTATQAQGGSVPLPPQLFSHIDQTNQWATSTPQSADLFGWAGRIGDLFDSKGLTANLSYNINVGGSNYWQQGKTTLPYVLGTSGAPTLAVLGKGYAGGTRTTAVQALMTQATTDPSPFVSQYQAIVANAGTKVSIVTAALGAAGKFTTMFPNNPGDGGQTGDSQLDAQLQEVALMIKANMTVGDLRQIFYVQILGFDTHNNELVQQGQLLKYVSGYMNNFWSAMGEINMQNSVTVFTMSEFGRTLGSNGDGSDHGWGSHQLVLGGAVKGGYYGTMPNLTIGGPDDFGSGRIVPTTATDQYAATIASWFGVAAADLPTVFPNLANFSSSNLGFLG
jgi:uncharacterized protein (DUF1501 family)